MIVVRVVLLYGIHHIYCVIVFTLYIKVVSFSRQCKPEHVVRRRNGKASVDSKTASLNCPTSQAYASHCGWLTTLLNIFGYINRWPLSFQSSTLQQWYKICEWSLKSGPASTYGQRKIFKPFWGRLRPVQNEHKSWASKCLPLLCTPLNFFWFFHCCSSSLYMLMFMDTKIASSIKGIYMDEKRRKWSISGRMKNNRTDGLLTY